MNKYLIATMIGGLIEQLKVFYEKPDIIEADNQDDALDIYNKKYNCSYFYGACAAFKDEQQQIQVLIDDVPYKWIKMLEIF